MFTAMITRGGELSSHDLDKVTGGTFYAGALNRTFFVRNLACW